MLLPAIARIMRMSKLAKSSTSLGLKGCELATMTRLSRDFFARDTLAVARNLLGQRLVRVLDGARLAGRIVEVEAYVGEGDQACHARFGRTRRNAPMYGPPGHAYVYFVYGMHHCLNVVTGREGNPAAVLIRALEPLEGIEGMRARRGGRPDAQLASGPAACARRSTSAGSSMGPTCARQTRFCFWKRAPPYLPTPSPPALGSACAGTGWR